LAAGGPSDTLGGDDEEACVEHDGLILEGGAALEGCLAAFSSAPQKGALFCDIDGTVSPIAPTPADAVVPEETKELLARLTSRLGLVAFVTGRALEDGRRMVDVPGAAYVGTHGLEVQAADGAVLTEPQAERYTAAIHEVAERAARELDCEALGVILEDKRVVLAVHYRLAPDPAATRHAILARVVEPARAQGLAVATGHYAFEIRPPLPFSKGAAVKRLLAATDCTAAMMCGDDLTDITAFEALRAWAGRDARRTACAVAAVTEETPRTVSDGADVRVRATPGVTEVLTRLLAATGG
jgi:trehalose 6-phosphate phosphatase